MTNVTPLRNLCEKAIEDLARSGITPAQGAELGMYSVPDASTLHKSFAPVRALVVPYNPSDPRGFYRIRYLEDRPRSFKQSATGKYSQPPGSGVEAYFTPAIDWSTIVHDTSVDIVITEGEKKAAAACMRDIATIGLGGVYNFKTKDTNFLPELEQFDWQDRNTFICYDSDAASNPHVQLAMARLTELLNERGARSRIIALPHGPRRAKVGLDDYLVQHSDDDFRQLLEKARDPDPPEFFAMNEDVCYIESIDRYVAVDKPTAPPMTLTTFLSSSVYASRTYPVPIFNGRGEASFKLAYVAPAWVKWERRHVREAIVYEPGQPRLIAGGVNRWPGWGCEAKKGDVKIFLELVDYLFASAKPEHREWFLDWLAYPIQNPGVKLSQSALVYGVTQGTGKTLLGLLIGDVYGGNFYAINPTELHTPFNGWAHYRQFIVGDEIVSENKRIFNNRMKAMITQEMAAINIKNQPSFQVRDCINYYFTSNHCDAVFLEASDRRFFIVEVPHTEPRERDFYERIIAWRDSGDSAPALRHWFERRKIAPSFSPGMHAPRTRARATMVMDSQGDLGQWCLELKTDAEYMLVTGQLKHQRDLFTATELLAMYQRDHDQNRVVTANGMTRALKNAGFVQVNDGQPVRGVRGVKPDRYFAIRNANKWLNPDSSYKVEPWLRKNIELPPK